MVRVVRLAMWELLRALEEEKKRTLVQGQLQLFEDGTTHRGWIRRTPIGNEEVIRRSEL